MILIFGGSGFIGSNFCKKIHMKNIPAIALGTRDEFLEDLSENMNFKKVHLNKFINAFDSIKNKIDHIVLSIPPKSVYSLNGIETDLLEIILHDVWPKTNAKLIYISSGGSVYGNHSNMPIKEDFDTKPIDTYGKSKLDEEKKVIQASKKYYLQYNLLRPANPIGANQSNSLLLSIFKNNVNHSHLNIINSGRSIRDFFHVNILVDVMLKLVTQRNHLTKNKIYNIGSGIGLSVNEFVDIVDHICSFRTEKKYISSKDRIIQNNILDVSEIEQLIDIKSNLTVESAILDAWNAFSIRMV